MHIQKKQKPKSITIRDYFLLLFICFILFFHFFIFCAHQNVTTMVMSMRTGSAGHQDLARRNANVMMVKSAVHWSSVQNLIARTRSRSAGSAVRNVRRKQVRDPYKFTRKWRLLISINWISLNKEMNPIARKSMSKLVTQPSFRAVGQTHAEWQTFENNFYVSFGENG